MIKICEKHQRYLKFKWGNSLYQFISMPFGLTSAPRQFTKLLKPVLSRLRMLGHSLCAYIDDILMVAVIRSMQKICNCNEMPVRTTRVPRSPHQVTT